LERFFKLIEPRRPRILLLEPNTSLRRAVHEVLTSEGYTVEDCDSLEAVVHMANRESSVIALVAWQTMEGLLADEHRHDLAELTRRVRLVLMVPRRWQRLLDNSDLGFAELVPKPFTADELLQALSRVVTADSRQAAGASD
jgi:DNA-binding response OmpR family regulator